MQIVELGNTGTTLPKIGLGTWQFNGGPDLLRTGIDLGAVFIDTAESYGTETVVGEGIRNRRHQVFLATKASPRHFRHKDLIASAEASLRRLRTDYLDLYQLHWPNYTVPIAETMHAMETLVDSGKIRFIGVSNFMLADLMRAQKAMCKYKIVSNQVRYNLIDRTIEHDLLQYCQNHGIAIIAYSPFSTRLASIRTNDPHDVIPTLAQQKGRTVAQIVLNWCISKKGVVTIPKSESVEHVRENCAASGFQLSEYELAELCTKVASRYRSRAEIQLRRLGRYILQHADRNQ